MTTWPAGGPAAAGGPGWPGRPAPPEPADRAAGPSRWWYVLVALLPLLGVAIGYQVGRQSWNDAKGAVRDATRYPVNERGTVTFDRPGSFTMYFEGPAATSSTADVDRLLGQLDIRFDDAASGEAVLLAPYETYRAFEGEDGLQQVAIKTFRIDRPGDFLLEVRTRDFRADRSSVSVGASPFPPLVRGLVLAPVAVALGLVAGVCVAIVVGSQRSRARRANLASQGGSWTRLPPPARWPPG